ncbi:MAG TPA: hypothetical protein GX723_09830 [Thermoanaerobacterales bacterium]|nr:hypothetical protein [Thermoanaerobacterales bacterium]
MKRYEEFNQMAEDNETAEKQAVGMTLEKVKEENNIEFDTDNYTKWFKVYFRWLSEEVQDV